MTALLTFLRRRSPAFILTAGAAVVLLFAVLDYLTGPDLRFFIFYWPPIAIVTWFVSRRWGIAFVLLSGGAWSLANAEEHLARSELHLLLWNAVVNILSFALLALLIDRLHALVLREQETARTDFVTQIPNSRAFQETLDQVLANARRGRRPVSLAFIDIDDFKLVNDTRGHAAGDALLRDVADTMRWAIRRGDTVARLGGDEFGIAFPDADAETARTIVVRLQAELAALAARRDWPISASVGVVTCAGTSCSSDRLLGLADTLMYEVKSAGKGGVIVETIAPDRLDEDVRAPDPVA